MSSGVNSSCIKTALLIGAGVATTTGIGYMVYRYLGSRQGADTDEGFVDETKVNTLSSMHCSVTIIIVGVAVSVTSSQ